MARYPCRANRPENLALACHPALRLRQLAPVAHLAACGGGGDGGIEITSDADVYDEIAEHWTGPVIVTELGWLSAPSPPYPGSEADQEEFVSTFFALTDDLDLEYVTWLFLHDWDGDSGEPLVKGIGFRDNLANVVRLSDSAWRAAVGLRERP